jgi:hypothetical protein
MFGHHVKLFAAEFAADYRDLIQRQDGSVRRFCLWGRYTLTDR